MAITLIENFRAAFYAPFYAAAALGAFKAEGLEVNFKASPHMTQTMQTLLTGGGDVSWGGPLRVLDARHKDPPNEPIILCEVVGRDPFFLIGRQPNPDFRLSQLGGRQLSVTTEVPTPWMCLQYDLRLAGVDPKSIALGPSRTMAENAAALRAGEADVIQVFQPVAEDLVRSGAGHIWYAAASRGATAYTSLNTTRGFATDNADTLYALCRAVYRTQKWIHAHDGAALARAIESYFPDVPQPLLAASFDRYLALGLWNAQPVQSREGLSWLQEAGLAEGRYTRRFDYDGLVDSRFALAAIKADPPSI